MASLHCFYAARGEAAFRPTRRPDVSAESARRRHLPNRRHGRFVWRHPDPARRRGRRRVYGGSGLFGRSGIVEGQPPLQVRLKQAVANITILVFLLQAQNDFDLSPTQILGPLFQQLNRPAMVQIYPPFGTGAVGQEGHNMCFTGADVWSTHRRVPVELIFAADRLRCGAMWCERATFRERARALARRQVLGTS
jgi:hypothetical protein